MLFGNQSNFNSRINQDEQYIMISFIGRRGIAPTRNCTHFLKSVLNIFLCIKLNFFSYNYVSFIFLNTLMVIIGIKPAPSDHESNFKKVGAIPCGCNTT